ncbi:MAG: U32 family peptidase [Acetatifactor sp.]|nr:U32 family peptidase [Acetatifactor sp.]
MEQRASVELLAPAGNKEGLYGAIHAGADAVYLGGDRFGARAYADNFTTEELVEGIRYAHLWGRKIYLTVNTLVKESEFSELHGYLLPFYEAGLDGVIVQDIGVFAYIRDHFPKLELHVSTQMTMTGHYGAALLKEMGACRIVPARELSLSEIVRIKKETGLSIETFIHGAMCYCYSGMCLFSSILGGRSGNRGRCAQPCRLPYKVENKSGGKRKISGECYPLSLKDMCTIEMLPALIEAGIDSLKIEGRMKKPEYTAGVTAIYRKYIDRYYTGLKEGIDWNKQQFSIEEADIKNLSCLYIRSERQDGYYQKHNGRDMVTLENPAYSGSDEALLARIRRDHLEKRPRMAVSYKASFETGKRAQITLSLGGLSVTVAGEPVSVADKQPITLENIEKQLRKLGDSVFTAERMDIVVSENAFYPLRAINELRRAVVRKLEDALILQNGLALHRKDVIAPNRTAHILEDRMQEKNTGGTSRLHLSLRTWEQLKAVLQFQMKCRPESGKVFERIYVDGDLLTAEEEESSLVQGDLNAALEACRQLSRQSEVIVALPYIIRQKDHACLDRIFRLFSWYPDVFSGVLVRSLDGLGWIKSLKQNLPWKFTGKIYADAGVYIWNRETINVWQDTLSGFCLPLELKSAEQLCLINGPISSEKIIYGRIPMMVTANCVVNTMDGCKTGYSGCQPVTTWLIDRYQKRFPVEQNCLHCYNIIYNSVPLSLHGELSGWKGRTEFRVDLTTESGWESETLLTYFEDLWSADFAKPKLPPPYGGGSGRSQFPDKVYYTTGHEKRGVE